MRGRARRLGSDELLRKMGRSGSAMVVDPPIGREQVAQIAREVPPQEWGRSGGCSSRFHSPYWLPG